MPNRLSSRKGLYITHRKVYNDCEMRQTSVWQVGWTSAASGKSTKVTEELLILIAQSEQAEAIRKLSGPFAVIGLRHQ